MQCPPNAGTYRALIFATGTCGGQWELALNIFERMADHQCTGVASGPNTDKSCVPDLASRRTRVKASGNLEHHFGVEALWASSLDQTTPAVPESTLSVPESTLSGPARREVLRGNHRDAGTCAAVGHSSGNDRRTTLPVGTI
eukprot:706974-Prorocentrum_minimum.AAC.1